MLASRAAAGSIRLWAAAATALAAAAAADVLTEFLSNTGLLGGGAVRDVHQEAVVPVALLAAIVLLSLALAVALGARRASGFSSAPRSHSEAFCLAAGTFVATLAVVSLMEGYETRFGGAGAFDARAVFLVHAPAALAACAAAATLVNRLVAFSLRAALAAGRAVAHVLVRAIPAGSASGIASAAAAAAFGMRTLRREFLLALRARGLRAPPSRRPYSLQPHS